MMDSSHEAAGEGTRTDRRPPLSTSERRTLDAIFRHPLQHNLEWGDVVALAERLGEVEPKPNGSTTFIIRRERYVMHKPHAKDLASAEVLELRHFLIRAGFSPELPYQAPAQPDPAPPSLLVAIDHHGARIYHIDVSSADAAEHVIKPYDPHHFLHHMRHKDRAREHGQKAAEDPSYYVRIAQALAAGGRIVVVGHGQGDSNAAHHLATYLREHHRETYARIAVQASADLSSLTDPQLLALGARALAGG